MAYVDVGCTNKNGTGVRNKGRVRINYTAGSGSLNITSIQGYRTDGYRAYGTSSSNKFTVTVNGTSYSSSGGTIGFGKNSTPETWTAGFNHSYTINGTASVTVTVNYCNNSDISGSQWGTASINCGYPAPNPGTAHVKSVTRTSAVLYASGYDTHGSEITDGGWDVSTNGGSTWDYHKGSPVGDKSITGLTPNTTYHFRNYVVTAGGGKNSGWSSFTTPGNAPTATSLSISNITRTSATVSINGTYDTNASWGGWECVYGTTTNYGSSTTGSMTGLTPNTTYYVKGRFKDNWGRWSNYVTTSFKTTGNAPSITSHGVSSYGQTTMTMRYGATYDTNDSLSSYKWDIGTTTSYGKTFNNTNSLTGLSANTTYYYRLTVASSQGRSSTATGTFKTDYATQSISSIVAEDITETSISGVVNVPNPTWLTNLTIWIYSGDTLINTINKSSGISASNSFLFEDLSPGTVYNIKARITTKTQNSSGGYNSAIKELPVTTVDASPVHIIRADGTDKKYKMYVMGRGNIYNPEMIGWQNGYYATGTVGQALSTTLTQSTEVDGGAACSTTWVEIVPNIPYTIINNDTEVDFVIHGTDAANNITTVGYTISPGATYTYTGASDTNKLWISVKSSTNPTVNYATAKFFRLNIFRTVEKTLIPKDNIVCVNGKIRYIDIIQAGSTSNDDSHIVALKVYNSAGNDIALGKTSTVIKGKGPQDLSRITNGNTDTEDYVTIKGKTSNDLETIVRVDLGKDYTDIDHIILWRYYHDNRTYLNTKLYGRDATTRLTWKFQDFRSQGEYPETSSGYRATIRHEIIEGVPMILSILQEPNSSTNTITGTKITINADWVASIPPVLDSWISYRTDAILAANQGRLLKQEIGGLSELTTDAKSSLVDAINEVWNDYNGTDEYTNMLNAVLNAVLNK